MTSGWLFLAVTTLICLGVFLVGLRFSHMPEERICRMHVEMPPWLAGDRTPGAQVHLLGRVFTIAAPIFFLFFAALCFGLLGPVDGIQTITF